MARLYIEKASGETTLDFDGPGQSIALWGMRWKDKPYEYLWCVTPVASSNLVAALVSAGCAGGLATQD
eukprot:SAG11_NODE_986_length_6284_cov_72.758771_6_plen_68_part_00